MSTSMDSKMKQHTNSEFQSIHTTENHTKNMEEPPFMRYLHCEIYAAQIDKQMHYKVLHWIIHIPWQVNSW